MAEVDKNAVEQDYLSGMKYKDLAEKYGVTVNTIKSWKQRYKWNKKGCTQNKKSVHTKKGAPDEQKIPKVDKALTEPLNENQRLFCEYYSNNRNAKMAYTKAYGTTAESAEVAGSRLLSNVKVRAYVDELLRLKRESIFLKPDDIVERYMRIAFADITDYVEFGRVLVPVMTAFGPLEMLNPATGKKEPVMREVNDVRFKESSEVDGGLICQIKQGKDGASLKLEDRQKALEWLANFFEMNPQDKHKRDYDNKRVALEERSVKLQEDKVHGVTQDIDKIKEGLQGIMDIIKAPVPDRVIEDE